MIRFATLVCLIALAFSTNSWGQTMNAADRLALRELNDLVKDHGDLTSLWERCQGHPVAWKAGKLTVGFVGKLDDGITEDQWLAWDNPGAGVHCGAVKHGVASFRLDIDKLDLLAGLPLTRVDLASRAAADLNKARYGTRVDSVHAGLGLPQAYDGEGVLIGVLDWGFDYTNPMFYDTALTASRIRAVWDQYRQAGPHPEGFTYGAEATTPWEIQLLESDTSNVYGYSTHGTHVAGIAGGGGAGIGLTGMAPAAEFLFATLMVDEAAALDAFAWMQQIAEEDDKRLVINNSWGLPQWGTPDGTSLSNVFIDAMSDEGVVFVSSNGNNGDSDFHIEHTFAEPGDTARSRVQFYPLSANPNAWGQNLTLWGEPGESFAAGFLLTQGISNVVDGSPMFHTAEGPLVLDTMLVTNSDTIVYDVAMEASHPDNGRPFLQIRVRKGSSNLAVVLQFTASTGRVHAWNHTHLSNDVGNWGQDFQAAQPTWLAGNPSYGIQQPACGQSVIAVGAYSSEHLNSQGTEVGGSLAYFSSYGPTLDERLKPNVSAPGVNVESSLSSFRDGTYAVTSSTEFDGATYDFAKLSGTSMSSPATAGVVALMLQANPDLMPGDVRDILELTAREDDDTGALPVDGDFVWGHGKVTATSALSLALSWVPGQGLPDDTHTPPLQLFPNPATDEVTVAFPLMTAPCVWALWNMEGQQVKHGNFQGHGLMKLSVADLPSGLYLFHAKDAGGQIARLSVIH